MTTYTMANTYETKEVPTFQNVSSELDMKRIAAYFKKNHKDDNVIVQRNNDGSFIMANHYLAVKVTMHPDLFQWLNFDASWEQAKYEVKDPIPQQSNVRFDYVWSEQFEGKEMQRLTLSHFLLEIAGSKGKPGKLYRKLATYKDGSEALRVMLDKSYTDMFTPDVDELEGFLFETQGKGKPVRVASRSGYCAVIMPLINAER